MSRLLLNVEKILRAEARKDRDEFLNSISEKLGDVIGWNESRHIYVAIKEASERKQANHWKMPDGFDCAIEYGFFKRRMDKWINGIESMRQYFEERRNE